MRRSSGAGPRSFSGLPGLTKPPDAIEAEAFERLAADMDMSRMGRVE
jgi:hypothetical protein